MPTAALRLPFTDVAYKRNWQPDEPPSLAGVDTVYLDVESTGTQWHRGDRPIGFAVRRKGDSRSYYLGFGHRGGGNIAEARVREWATRELRGKRIANHSTKFDYLITRAWGVNLEAQGCTFHDVAHSAALLNDHRQRFNLNELAEDELHRGKVDVGPKDDLAGLPAWALADYAKRDVELVEGLEAVYAPKLRAENLDRVQTLEDEVIPAVAEMEWNGVPYEEEMLHAWAARLDALEQDYLWELRRTFGFTIDGKKTSLKKLFAVLGLEPGKKVREHSKDPEKIGEEYESFAYEFIVAAAEKEPRLRPLERLLTLRTLRSKAIKALLEDGQGGIYYPTYHQLRSVTNEGEARGVVSGRFSAPYIHQITGLDKYFRKYGAFGTKGTCRIPDGEGGWKEVPGETFWARELFREVDGYWFAADARQIQYRVFAHCSQSPRLLKMYQDDPLVSFHKIVRGWILPIRPDIDMTRTKIANFLTIFGGGVVATAAFFKCSIAEAQEFRDVYFEAFPEAQETITKVKDIAEGRGYVRSLMGRRSRHPYGVWIDKRTGEQRRGRLRTHKALNEVCQMNEADITKRKMVILHRERKTLGFTPRVTLHDEVDGRLEDAAAVPRIMELLNEQDVPMSVPILWGGGVAEGRQSWANAK